MTATTTFENSFAGAVLELAMAYEQVPFYGPHLDAAGLRPDDVRTPADFRGVPPTGKADYRRHFPAGVLTRGSTLADDFVFRSRSSGTTGERLVTLAHTFTLAQRQMRTTSVHQGMLRVFAGARPQRVCRYAPPACSDVECATPFTTAESRTLEDGTLVLPVAHDLLATSPELVEQAAGELLAHDPHWLYADPAHLAFLLDAMAERDLPLPAVGGVVLAYNLATASALRRIRARLPDATVVEVASMSELGWLGMTCPLGQPHLNTDSFYLELLAYGTDRPAEPGEPAELYVTSIGDRLSPHIRYRTGDGYTLLDGDCPCGHRFPRAVHHGRCRDYVVDGTGEVVLTPRMLDELAGPAGWLTFYKLTHHDTGPLLLRYIPVPATDHAEPAARLGAAIRERTGREVTVSAAGHIESERSGKLFGLVREAR